MSKNRENFETLIKRWITLEDSTIEASTDFIESSDNPMVKAIIDLVKLDSEKHKRILEAIRLSLNSTVTFSTDDLNVVGSFIEKHAAMEKNAVETAEQAVEMSSLPIPKFLLEQLLQDEKNHDAYMRELNEIKRYMAKDT